MRDFIAKRVRDMEWSGIRKFADIAAQAPEALSLCVGEPDFKTPERVRHAAADALEAGKTRYTANMGLPELRAKIAHYLERRFALRYNPAAEILCTIGASEAIDAALRAILEPGDEILVPEPSYVAYKPAIILGHGVPVVVTTKAENGFRLTADELEAAVTPKTKALILPYPNNPTGAVMERVDLERLVPVILKHDLLVISDEIYAELTYGGMNHISIATLEGMRERTIVLNGFAKSFSMTGWRMGFAAGPEDLIQAMRKIHAYVIMCAPAVSQYGALEALRDDVLCDADIARMREAYDERRKYMLAEFRRLGMDCFEPKGAFYVFPSIRKTGLSSQEFCERLLFEGGVAVVPGDSFGESGEGHVRISYAYSMEELKACIEKIEAFLKRLGCE